MSTSDTQTGGWSRAARPGALLLFLAAAAGNACEAPTPPEPKPRLVRFLQIAVSGEGRSRTFSGIAQSADEPQLSFKVGGTITNLPVKMGDRVAEGRLIAEIDPTDYQLNLEDAAASVRRAEAELHNAEAAFRRTRDLYENGNASRTEYDAARAGAESARAAEVSAQKRLELARRQLDYTQLRAPAAGSIASVDAVVNENVRAGQSIVMLVTSGSGLEVVITMPESLIAQVKRDQAVSVRFDALPGRSLRARVAEVGVAATGAGTTFPVAVRLLESDPGIRAGMAAEVTFRFATQAAEGRLCLPSHTVGEDRAGRFVFVVEPEAEGRAVARRRAVEIGELTSEGLEILGGLDDGDRVVTAGIASLTDGDVVRLGPSS
jgi:RND family efflux transporter MFP subunit